jgi:TRAP-type C4-dicarboxylate transport system permease small subunit
MGFVISTFGRFLSLLETGANFAAAVALLAIMSLLAVDIVLRYIFRIPIAGSQELVEQMMVWVVFLALSYAQRRGSHIRSDFLTTRFSTRQRNVLKSLRLALGTVLCGFIAFEAWPVAWHSFGIREHGMGLLSLPLYPSRFAFSLGISLLCVQYISDLFGPIIKRDES